ncbi:MAG: cell division protein FtsQ/DivIB [Bacteroidales bacterium]|nr:cell division protein FtsQ/DivIB [Bacteroidales bacterium]
MKKFIGIVIWSIVIAGVFVSLVALREGYKKTTCSSIEVMLDDEQGAGLISKSDVLEAIHNAHDSIVGKRVSEIDLLKIDRAIEQTAFVKEADVFTTLDGELHSRIHSWDPVARIVNNQGKDYYIDRSGKLIPTRQGFPVRTLIISGYTGNHFSDTLNLKNLPPESKKVTILHRLFPMIMYLKQDEFFRAQIEQIYLDKHGEIELIPKVGNHVVVFGTVENFEQKLDKLFAFYRQGLKQSGWNKYKTINLKYKDQVVCSKH